jgi:peptide/nickel transport system substrate-binding protein
MNRQLKTVDQAKRKELWDEVQQIMSEQVPLVYLVTPNSYAGLKNKWRNVEIPSTGSLIWNLDELYTLEP